MPTPNTANTDPTRTTTEVADGIRAAFQNKGAALFSKLGLRDGGFQANANRVFILDDTGKLVPAPPYDAQNDNGMTAAAQDGRLYIMDGNFRFRQVQLEGNEDEGFTFNASNPLRRKQLPPSSMSYMDYYIKRFQAIFDDFLKDMSENFNEMKSNMSKSFDNMQKAMSKLFGGHKESEQAGLEVEAEPLVPQNELLETQQTVSTLEEDQPIQSALTTEELLAKNPTKQTTPEFERYLNALADRGNGSLVDAALNKETGEPNDYYEALAQELEGQVARRIRDAAPSEQNPKARKLFLDGQKPIVATISKDLREFVRGKVDSQLVTNFFAQDFNARSPMRKELQETATRLQNTGVNEYLNEIRKHNEEKERNNQQSVKTNEIEKGEVKEVGQTQYQHKVLG